jgi:hypothetical protein
VAEGARLESVFTRKGNVGSNPTLSARLFAFNELSAIHTVVHTVKPIPGAVCEAILFPFTLTASSRDAKEAPTLPSVFELNPASNATNHV